MEAMSTVEKLFLREQNPNFTEEEIDEYERLLSDRFTVDPDRVARLVTEEGIDREERIAELYYRIYGASEE